MGCCFSKNNAKTPVNNPPQDQYKPNNINNINIPKIQQAGNNTNKQYDNRINNRINPRPNIKKTNIYNSKGEICNFKEEDYPIFDAMTIRTYCRYFRAADEQFHSVLHDPELSDVDGIIQKISIWFYGHASKMLGIKNMFCKMYDDKMQEYRIEHADADEDDDDEELFNRIFGGGDG